MYPIANPHFRAPESSLTPRGLGALVAVALHAVALMGLLNYQPARSALLAAAPIMVNWIAEPQVEARKETPKRKPNPVAQLEPQPVQPDPVVAAAEAPSPVTAPAPPPTPTLVAVPDPAPLTMPIFNADYLDNPAPSYPALSRRLHEQGRVLLRVLVNPGGRADKVQIQSSSGHARLDSAARDAVRVWKFVPAKRGAELVPAWVLIPVSFRLEG